MSALGRGLIDGTMKSTIEKDRKLNENNALGIRVHLDKEGVSRYTFLAQLVTLIKTSTKYYGCGNSIFETIRVDECDYRNF